MFYTFYQNNSGGHDVENDDLTKNVIIEANSADEANAIATRLGIYFDGCSYGRDCNCCGDRWYPVYEGEGKDFPSYYGTNVFVVPLEDFFGSTEHQYIIHYLNGSKVRG